MDDIRRFLTALFEYKQDDHYILVWTLAKRMSAWFTDIEAAARHIEAHSGEDCYVGAGLSPKDMGISRRVAASQVVAVAGFVADVDYGARKRPGTPTQEQALAFLEQAPIAPTVIVSSGHGYHAWWLFAEPWQLESDEERREASWLSKQWGETLKAIAAERGFAIDNVSDLARVMRCPGTTNAKEEPATKAVIISLSDWRAPDLDVFYEHIREEAPATFDAVPTEVPGSELVLNPNASPTLPKFEALKANNKLFEASCNHARRDVSGWTNSEYDLSIASFAMLAGWSDQEIVDLIIYSRNMANEDLKLRPDYYQRTLRKARSNMAKSQAADDMAVIEPGDPETPDMLATYLGVRIERVIRYQQRDGSGKWFVHIGGRRVLLGPIAAVRTLGKFSGAIEDATLRVVSIKKTDWPIVLGLLYGMAESEELDEEGDETQIVRSWLTQYLDGCGTIDPDGDANKRASGRRPFVWENELWISLSALREWVYTFRQEQLSTNTLAISLRELGSESRHKFVILKSDRRTTYNVWRVPSDIAQAHIGKTEQAEQPQSEWWQDN